MEKLVRIDKNGTKYFEDDVCHACNGTGMWGYGRPCFKCNGTGKRITKRVERTPEYEKILADKRLERERKQAPEKNRQLFSRYHLNDDDGSAYIVLGNTYPIKDELKEKGAHYNPVLGWYFDHDTYDYPVERIEKNYFMDLADNDMYELNWNKAKEVVDKIKSNYKEKNEPIKIKRNPVSKWIGEVGQKITENVSLKKSHAFISSFTGDVMCVYTFETELEDLLVWITSERSDLEEGQAYEITGRIKEHSEFRGEKQTVLTRCKYIRK